MFPRWQASTSWSVPYRFLSANNDRTEMPRARAAPSRVSGASAHSRSGWIAQSLSIGAMSLATVMYRTGPLLFRPVACVCATKGTQLALTCKDAPARFPKSSCKRACAQGHVVSPNSEHRARPPRRDFPRRREASQPGVQTSRTSVRRKSFSTHRGRRKTTSEIRSREAAGAPTVLFANRLRCPKKGKSRARFPIMFVGWRTGFPRHLYRPRAEPIHGRSTTPDRC